MEEKVCWVEEKTEPRFLLTRDRPKLENKLKSALFPSKKVKKEAINREAEKSLNKMIVNLAIPKGEIKNFENILKYIIRLLEEYFAKFKFNSGTLFAFAHNEKGRTLIGFVEDTLSKEGGLRLDFQKGVVNGHLNLQIQINDDEGGSSKIQFEKHTTIACVLVPLEGNRQLIWEYREKIIEAFILSFIKSKNYKIEIR